MKSYRRTRYTGKAKKQKILGAILWTAFVLGVFVGALILGNIFRMRLENAAPALAYEPEEIAPSDGGSTLSLPPIPPKGLAGEKVLCLPMPESAVHNADDRNAVLTECKEREAGLSFLFSADTPWDTLVRVTESAKAADLYLSLILAPTFSAQADAALFETLEAAGGRDVLLYGLSSTALSEKELSDLLIYLTEIRRDHPGLTLGLALSPALFADAAAGDTLDTLAAAFDYLAADLSHLSPEAVPAAWQSLYGSAAYYELALFCRDGEPVRQLNAENVRLIP